MGGITLLSHTAHMCFQGFPSGTHIDSELPKVLIKVLFWALFGVNELFWALFLVLLKVPELFWALFKALYFALYWNTFLEHFFKH